MHFGTRFASLATGPMPLAERSSLSNSAQFAWTWLTIWASTSPSCLRIAAIMASMLGCTTATVRHVLGNGLQCPSAYQSARTGLAAL